MKENVTSSQHDLVQKCKLHIIARDRMSLINNTTKNIVNVSRTKS
jgi:hypothetical protein